MAPGISSKVRLLPKEIGSLARELPPTPAGTLFALGANGGMSVEPDAEFTLLFGRNEPEVHVCVGVHDTHVSRRHGYIRRERSLWVLNNAGRLPIRLPGARLVLGGDWVELRAGYTPMFIVSPQCEHLLEVRISAQAHAAPRKDDCEAKTDEHGGWHLDELEKLVLVCLAQRYLRSEPFPQPLTWAQVADHMGQLRPDERWGVRRVAHIVEKVRKRLSSTVSGLLDEEIPPPVGNALNHNLIMELLVTTTLTKDDLNLVD
jgi:hypothetical protein